MHKLGKGYLVYEGAETNAGGSAAIDFNQSELITPGDVFIEMPIRDFKAGTYEWVRMSVSYQNYNVLMYYKGAPYTGTVASFVGFNTYITDYKVRNKTVTVNDAKKQGYWGFESTGGSVTTGQAPEGATTVPNPMYTTSSIPAGSCVVTGKFELPFTITGNEKSDIEITLSLSTNQSFEWVDVNKKKPS